jgi:hypothetical protein
MDEGRRECITFIREFQVKRLGQDEPDSYCRIQQYSEAGISRLKTFTPSKSSVVEK